MYYQDKFHSRHIGPNSSEMQEMLSVIGVDSLEALISQTVPSAIRTKGELNLPPAISEFEYLRELKTIAAGNKVFRSYMGMGYYGTITPSAIRRNVFENPGWYTQYTPYQAEIAQGRLEALLIFQTMVSDMCGLEIANASLLDEGTAASEAMLMFFHHRNRKARTKEEYLHKFYVSDKAFPQTIDILRTRAIPLGIELVIENPDNFNFDGTFFGALVQYPDAEGKVQSYENLIEKAHSSEAYVAVASDLLALALIEAPGKWKADVVLGNSQRFGVPMGFGGPHAAFFATNDEFKRIIPGRIIGVSQDRKGRRALRMALQTREQHIKREKATSNICTAQALLAIMAAMYAAYHGPVGIREIAEQVNGITRELEKGLKSLGFTQSNAKYFDTLLVNTGTIPVSKIREIAEKKEINFHYLSDNTLTIALDETVLMMDVNDVLSVFAEASGKSSSKITVPAKPDSAFFGPGIARTTDYLTHEVFNRYHSETELMRFIKRMENKDLSLTGSMIPLGSCTMKLNAATELYPVSWPEFSSIHPFAPADQTKGYQKVITDLENFLIEITGFTAASLQPNSGAQGEYAGLLTMRAYHLDRGDTHRTEILIPTSAHGTNPASAVMAGMKVVLVACDEMGNINVNDLKEKAEKHKDNLCGLMVTYPSTHGVFEETIREVCQVIHDNGGLVYMDGANMNAQVGLTSPASIGADVCHINLHKTFAIPHGGGGPGMGPICVNDKLAPYLPGHSIIKTGGDKAVHAVSAAPWGSASILLISYGYIRLLGASGCTDATKYAILNANYLKAKLEKAFPVLYQGKNGRVAHEFILDFRSFKTAGIEVGDVAKRLMDYSFHAPTVSFPVAGTLMIEPTESEPKHELDRFVEAMLSIREEIREVEQGIADHDDNVLKMAPHTATELIANDWLHPYSREKAAYPVAGLREWKFWMAVARVNDTLGDRNLICTCPPIEEYADAMA